MNLFCLLFTNIPDIIRSDSVNYNYKPHPPYYKTWSKVSLGFKLMLSLSLLADKSNSTSFKPRLTLDHVL
jgi:hypothetical protein